MNEQKQPPKLVEVTLAKPHTHAGQQHPAGARIKVTVPEHEWLVGRGIVAAPAQQKEVAK